MSTVQRLGSNPLPYLAKEPLTRGLCAVMAKLAKRQVLAIEGLDHLLSVSDPFILVANHSQRLEAVLLPSLLMMARAGKPVHFMADWPMMMVPGVGLLYRRARVIPVFSKSAKPRFLNHLKALYEKPGSAWQRAGELLKQGGSVGVFVEGTMNRDPQRLLRGRNSAVRLALEHGVPLLPVGLAFPGVDDRPISDLDKLILRFGKPVSPVAVDDPADRAELRRLHGRIMTEISALCGKSWTPEVPRRRRRR